VLVQALVHGVRLVAARPHDADGPVLDAVVVVLLRLPAPHHRAFLHQRDEPLLLLLLHLLRPPRLDVARVHPALGLLRRARDSARRPDAHHGNT